MLALIAFYSSVGIAYLVLPIIREFGGVLLGSRLLSTDVFLNAGILEWGYHSLFSSTRHFFDWNAGFPLSYTLAVTENLVGWQLFYYPLRLLGLGVPAAYNTVLLVSLLIAGIGSALLARRLGASRWGAALAGLVFGYGPFHLDNIMHLQTMAVCWIPFAILFLDRYLEKPTSRDALGLVACVVMTVLSGIYIGVFLAITLPLYVLVSVAVKRHRWSRKTGVGLLQIGIVSAVAIIPISIPYIRFETAHGSYGASAKTLAGLSMEWLMPARTPSFQLAWASTPLRWSNPWDGEAAFFGLLTLIFIIVGITRLRDTSRRSVVLTLVVISLMSYLLALGPYFKTAGSGPARVIDWVPMPGRLWLLVPGVRIPSRFFFIAWLGGAILAGLGFTVLERRVKKELRLAFAMGVLLLVLLEYWPASWLSKESVVATNPMQMSDAYRFLSGETDSGGVIELPIQDEQHTRVDYGRYIYGSAGHLRRVVALHGDHDLPITDSLTQAAYELPADAQRIFLADHGVTRVVVHRNIGDASANARIIAELSAAGYPTLFNGSESAVFAIPRAP
jgi:hypothetical protein